MMERFKSPLIFSAGLIIGSVVTWLCVKDHYRSEKEEEIASVKEVYAKRFDNINKEAIEKAAIATNKPDISIYMQASKQAKEKEQVEDVTPEEEMNYEEEKQEFSQTSNKMYEITSSEFASFSNDRTRITITRFADDVFTDEMYGEINPLDYLDGELVPLSDSKPVNCLDYIRRMPQDEICIRNFDLGLDLDIITESRTYSDFIAT